MYVELKNIYIREYLFLGVRFRKCVCCYVIIQYIDAQFLLKGVYTIRIYVCIPFEMLYALFIYDYINT